ncbi:hypothetical protein [Pyxidicoccus sp. MSG2]|uniref:hypothetical protein n=1 Tax=Pyxidicoccus sp. MSG2 TaxID=2996790 RepID=UPI002270366D|nr:hypothetical protein [Pyxidicoccus sp. MSG2]MCY1017071.1 hypothetical protein [Pyxidicoccus sp. MSG2]
MAGQILGAYCRAVMSSMLDATATLLFPQHRKRIAEMKDDAWYPMEDYVRMIQDLHAKLGDTTMTALGQAAVQKTFHLTKAQGFDTLEKVFKDFNALSSAVVRNATPDEAVRTVSLTKDTVVMESESKVPPSLMVGYFRGLFFAFGKLVTSETVERKGDTVRYTLKWL